ncbi:MAG: CHAT domain-containing protein [Burkholderiales bacterium]
MAADHNSNPITFVVPGQRLDAVTRSSGSGPLAVPLGLGGTLKASVRLGALRSGSPPQRLVAVPGRDVVVLHVANGPSLVLHPATARDLLMAQSGTARGSVATRGGGSRSEPAPTTVEVPLQLRWQGLESTAVATRGATRGWLGDVLLAGLDIVTDHLKDKAQDYVAGELVERIDAQVDEGVYALQPRALSKLKSQPRVPTLPDAQGAPTLVLVHGTFSNTADGFGKLWTQHPQRVQALFKHYAGRVFALDHRTLGVSPIENALTLARACPPGTRLHLVTHSRGGLVAEVLARAAGLKALGRSDLDAFAGAGLAPQRQALQELVGLMAERNIRVERVVRVACPARGTLLASQRLDAYLSVLKWALDLAQVPVLPALLDFIGGVAQRREDPTKLPGVAAMIPDSPLVQWLHAADEPVPGDLRVVAGDLQGDSIGSWLKTLMADAYYRTDHDLVVHSSSMYGGAPRAAGASFVFDQGGQVTHFNYFANERTAEAVVNGLLQEAPGGYRPIGPLSYAGESSSGLRGARGTGAPQADKPAVFVLPGILGSHLKVDGKRIWLGWRLLGGLKRLAYPEAAGTRVEPDGPIGLSYDDLMAFLSASHEVIAFSFDWRKPIEQEAERLGAAVAAALDARAASGQPVRIVAHSMGGVVARTMQLQSPQIWDRMMAQPGARLVMLGTPNGGSWAPMQVLSGDDTFGNTLVAFGAPLQDRSARQLMAQFPGFIQLQAELLDAAKGLHLAPTWQRLAEDDLKRARDHNWWHHDERQLTPYEWGVPQQAVLDQAVALRRRLDEQVQQALPAFSNKLLLVVGQADFTPDGFELGSDGLVYLNAPQAGDGRVTLASALLPGVRTWQLGCGHGKLPDESDAFEAYRELLDTGTTTRLAPLAAVRGAGAVPALAHVRSRPARQRHAETVPEDVDALYRLEPAPAQAAAGSAAVCLPVTVHNGDLKFVREPLLVGHYRSVKLTGTERVINRLLHGTMEASLAMGQYPDEPGTHQVFLNCGVNADNPLQMPRPASVVVVGLGEEGKLKGAALSHTVKLGVLALAQRLVERDGAAPAQFEVAATLVGSGGVGISAGQAAQLIAQGVRDADLSLADTNERLDAQQRKGGAAGLATPRPWPRVARLHLVELYLDRASEAWRALRVLAAGGGVQVAEAIAAGAGALRRPLDGGYRGASYDLISAAAALGPQGDQRIQYTIDTKRARAEVRAQSTQARLVHELVAKASNDQNQDPQIGRTLFQLLVPVELEPHLNSSSELLLQLDRGTAGIPWELLDTSGAHGSAYTSAGSSDRRPWAIRTRLLRKLSLDDYRAQVLDASADAQVLVIGEPLCTDPAYPRLPGARADAGAVQQRLMAASALGAERVQGLISPDDTELPGPDARAVIGALMSRPWRIVHIAGHGEAPETTATGADGDPRGVVLSNGTFLGPREIGNMRVVPELVFVNCCHLAARNNAQLLQTDAARELDRASFAANVAEALIKIGVRCVVAAGWAVEDGPAMTFATTFYDALLRGQRFVEAVGQARETAHALGGNTWAAYQCYGDPDWVLRRDGADAQRPALPLAEQFEAVASPPALALALETLAVESRYQGVGEEEQRARIRHLEARFAAAWGGIGAVAEAFGVAWDAAGDRDTALAWYRRAMAAGDGSASFKASEQAVNLSVRAAWEQVQQAAAGKGPAKAAQPLKVVAAASRQAIGEALGRVDLLLALQPTLERHALRGSAHKRLALIARAVGDAAAEAQALTAMAADYAAAEQVAAQTGQPALQHYPALNRLAAEAALQAGQPGWGGPDATALAAVRTSLTDQARHDPDFWSVIGLTDLRLLEALARRELATVAKGLLSEYADLQARVPAPSYWASVHDQLTLLLSGYAQRVKAPTEAQAAQLLLERVASWLGD